MSINEIYSIGQSGLASAKSMLQLASYNIANANSAGYSRQVMQLTASAVPGLGVDVSDPRSIKEPFIARALVDTSGRAGFHEGRLSALTMVEQTLNELDGDGIGIRMDAFQDALQVLTSNPSGLSERQAVVDAAQAMAEGFQATRTQLVNSQDAAVGQAKALASQISVKTSQIAALNMQIKRSAASDETNALIDRRDQLVSELGGLIDVQVVSSTDGSVRLYTSGGRPLVESEFASKVTVSDPGPPPSYTMTIGIEKANGTAVEPLTTVGGQLGGIVDAQNEVIGQALHRLDEVAWEFTNAFNQVQGSSTAVDAQGNSNTNPFFVDLGPSAVGAANKIGVHPGLILDPSLIAAAGVTEGYAPGDPVPTNNLNALAMIAVFDQQGVLPNNMSVREGLSDMVDTVTSAIVGSESGLEAEGASAQQLTNMLQSETAVTVDEELIQLTVANQAYAAAGTVIDQARQMSDTLLGLIG